MADTWNSSPNRPVDDALATRFVVIVPSRPLHISASFTTSAPGNSVAVLLEANRGARCSASAPVGLADAGVENVNAQVDELIDTGVLRRLLAFTELTFSNSMIEAWWRSLTHQWLLQPAR